MHQAIAFLSMLVLSLALSACGGGGGDADRAGGEPPAPAPSFAYPNGNWYGLTDDGERVVLQVTADGGLLFVVAPGALDETRGDLVEDERLAPVRGYVITLRTGEQGTALFVEGPAADDRHLAILIAHDSASHIVLSPANAGGSDEIPDFVPQDLLVTEWRGEMAPFRTDGEPQGGAAAAALTMDGWGRAWGDLGPQNLFLPAEGKILFHLELNRWGIEVVDGATGDPRLIHFNVLPSKQAALVISYTLVQAANGLALKHVRVGLLARG